MSLSVRHTFRREIYTFLFDMVIHVRMHHWMQVMNRYRFLKTKTKPTCNHFWGVHPVRTVTGLVEWIILDFQAGLVYMYYHPVCSTRIKPLSINMRTDRPRTISRRTFFGRYDNLVDQTYGQGCVGRNQGLYKWMHFALFCRNVI